jgi:hypothetical protein
LPQTLEADKSASFLRLAQLGKDVFIMVNDYFENQRNAEIGVFLAGTK